MIVPGLTDTFRAETLFGGIHLPEHEYYLALYNDLDDGIVLGPHTMAYSPEMEVSGPGYTAGGKRIERIVQLRDTVACMDVRVPAWPVVTLRDVRGALIYNRSLEGMNSVMVIDFGEPCTAVNGPFVARVPEPGPETSAYRWVK